MGLRVCLWVYVFPYSWVTTIDWSLGLMLRHRTNEASCSV